MTGRLLIVDDERGIVVALKGLFSKEGYEVETAESGEEALAKLNAGLFHVIITDLSMKGMSGLDLLRHARSLWRKRREIRRSARLSPGAFRQLLRAHAIGARQVAEL